MTALKNVLEGDVPVTSGADLQSRTQLSFGRKIIGYCCLFAIVASIAYFSIYKSILAGGAMTTESAFLFMLLALVIGEVLAIRTKASLPAIFITAVLFVAGFWTFFPKDILQQGGIAPNLPGFCVMIMVVNLGTMLDKEELVAQWRTIIITLAGMAGIIAGVMTLGSLFLGVKTAAVATPPLTGGLVSAIMMQNVLQGDNHLFILAMAVYVLQGFAGFPLTNICLKIEGRNMLARYRKGELTPQEAETTKHPTGAGEGCRIFPETPKAYQTDYAIMFKTVLLVVLAGYLETMVDKAVSKFVFALLLGVLGAELGFIERKPLERSRSIGMFMMIIMMYVFSGLSGITLPILIDMMIEFCVLISLSVVGIALFAIPIGVKLGLSKAMSFAIGLGTLAGGFPASYVLSDEAAKILSENEEEYQLLLNHFLPKTLVAGFISATTGSVLIAGFFINMFFSK